MGWQHNQHASLTQQAVRRSPQSHWLRQAVPSGSLHPLHSLEAAACCKLLPPILLLVLLEAKRHQESGPPRGRQRECQVKQVRGACQQLGSCLPHPPCPPYPRAVDCSQLMRTRHAVRLQYHIRLAQVTSAGTVSIAAILLGTGFVSMWLCKQPWRPWHTFTATVQRPSHRENPVVMIVVHHYNSIMEADSVQHSLWLR